MVTLGKRRLSSQKRDIEPVFLSSQIQSNDQIHVIASLVQKDVNIYLEFEKHDFRRVNHHDPWIPLPTQAVIPRTQRGAIIEFSQRERC